MRGSGFLKPIFAELDDVVEQRHHVGDVERAPARAADRVGGQIVGDAAGLERRLDAPERLHHLRPQIAGEQGQHLPASHLGAKRTRFCGEQGIERVNVHFRTLEFRPGVFQVIGGVGAPDNAGRQPALGFEARKRLEWRRCEYSAEIPDYRFEHWSLPRTHKHACG